MSGSRLTRKVTVEGSKKISDTSAPRKSVFDRLGPGATERSQSKRDDYNEPKVEKCRYWLKDGRCPFGSKCRYDHGASLEAKSKLKLIRSIVSKNEESAGERKMKVKRLQSPEENPSEHFSNRPAKRMKTESIKVTKESLREDINRFKECQREKEEPKIVQKRKEVAVRRSSLSGWNLHDESDSEEENNGKQLDWEVRGAMHHAREIALEERRNTIRREIAEIDEHDEPVRTIPSVQPHQDSSPPYQEEVKHEKKKKSKSDKSKKKMKKKLKSDAHRMHPGGFPVAGEYGEKVEKPKKTKSSGGKKKKKHSNDSDLEMMQAEIPYRKAEFETEVFHRDYQTKKKSDRFHSPTLIEQASKSRHGHESRREKNPGPPQFEPEVNVRHFDKRNRSSHGPPSFEKEHLPPHQFERDSRGVQYVEGESRQPQMERESRQLEREARQYEREARKLERESRQAQLEKESRQFDRESHLRESHLMPHMDREPRKTQFGETRNPRFEREPWKPHMDRESLQVMRQPQYERELQLPEFERESRRSPFERESRLAAFEREPRQATFERGTRSGHLDKDTRPGYYERAPHSPVQSISPPLEKGSRSAPSGWEDRPPDLEAQSPVLEKRHGQGHVDQPRSGKEQISRTEHRGKQKNSAAVASERQHKEERTRKKETPQLRNQEKQNVVDKPVREEKKQKTRSVEIGQKEPKQKVRKHDKPREVAEKESVALPVLQEQEQPKLERTKPSHDQKKIRGPRTPSPEIKALSTLSRNPKALPDKPSEPASISEKRDKKDSRQKSPPQVAVMTDVKPSKKEKPVPKQKAKENVSESSDSDSSSSSSESEGKGIENVSGDEKKSSSGPSEQIVVKKKKKPIANEVVTRKPATKETIAKEVVEEVPKHEGKKPAVSEEQRERSTDGAKQQNKDEVVKEKSAPEAKKEDRSERSVEQDRRNERHEKHHAKNHKRPRDAEAEKRLDGRTGKDTRDARDSRDHREYRDFPRGSDYRDPRDRERFREFDERDRHHPFDGRREYRDGGPPDYGRGGWGRGGRDGYDGYDARGGDYDERRGGPGEFDRHYERDRPHTDRGGRFREVEDRHDAGWYERRGERGYRDSERYQEGRDRFQEDGKNSGRGKRARVSPEASRGERKGHRKERKRGSGTPPAESEEWDYEEGYSPAAKGDDQRTSSRKRPKEPSPAGSSRSDSTKDVKRKKVATPEPAAQDATPKSSEAVEKKEPSSKEDDGKKSKKDKGKKPKKRQSSEEETGATEAAAATPERRRVRESETKEKPASKTKLKIETPKKSASDAEGETKAQQPEATNAKVSEVLPVATEEVKPEKKPGEQVFSDLSEATSGEPVLDNVDGAAALEEKQEKSESEIKKEEGKVSDIPDLDNSVDDVYDPISDDELEAIIAEEGGASKVKDKKQTLDIEDVDWSILGSSTSEKVSEPGDYIKRFSAGNIFSRIGISSALAGPTLTKTVQEKCSQSAPEREMKDLLLRSGERKLSIGALVAAEARKLKKRSNVVNDIGPCRRALCARRDFHIRKQLRKLTTTKLGSKLLLDNTAVEPVDSGLFAMSVAIFRRGMSNVKDEPDAQSPTLPETSHVLAC